MKIPRAIALPLLTIPWLAAACVVGWILLNRFPPTGQFMTTSPVDGKSAFINPFLPSERVSVAGEQPDGWIGQRITGDPTYFTARIPGPYDKVDVDIEFRPVHQTLLEFGRVLDAAGNDLELTPLYSSELASDNWHAVDGGYVRNVPASRLTATDPTGLAMWDATSPTALLMDPAGPTVETPVSLRGAHDFYFVPAAGSLEVTFAIQDVNRSRSNASAVFRIYQGDQEIKHDVLDTSGSRETRMGLVMEYKVSLYNLAPSVYHIAFQADDDVFLRSIQTTSKHWVVGPRLYIGDVVGYATTTYALRAWTTSRHIVAQTNHVEGLQNVNFGSSNVKVVRTHEAFRLDRIDSVTAPVVLSAPKGDIKFISDGWFALREDAFFDPKPRRFTDGTDTAREGIVGVITPYAKPQKMDDGWLKARFTYPLDPTQDHLRFVLSAPGIASRVGAVDIRRITLTYRRPPLSFSAWSSLIRQEVVNAWHRL